MKWGVIILILCFITSNLTFSQSSSRWKRMRYEVFYGLGATNFLGELGGADREELISCGT
jgi:hypothetical protein